MPEIEPRIIRSDLVGIGRSFRGGFLSLAVMVEYSDGSFQDASNFYPDEQHFDPKVFLGMTEREAWEYTMNRHRAYIQSWFPGREGGES